MPPFRLPLVALIRENLSIMLDFAFSRQPIETMLGQFQGEWKYLRQTALDVAAQRAEKACVELAVFLRFLDDREQVSKEVKTWGASFGKLHLNSGKVLDLRLRDVSNVIIHTGSLSWDTSNPQRPHLISEKPAMKVASKNERENWIRAEIDLTRLASVCGNLVGP